MNAQRHAHRMALAYVASDDFGEESTKARATLLARVADAETILGDNHHGDSEEHLREANRAADSQAWGPAVEALAVLEDLLVDGGFARWRPGEGYDAWRLVRVETPSELDRRKCETELAMAQRDGAEAGDRHDGDGADHAGYRQEMWRLAIRLHDGDPAAKDVVRRRLATLTPYLMLRGGTNFLTLCRQAIAAQKWGDLLCVITHLEGQFIYDKTMRREFDEDSGLHLPVPTGRRRELPLPENHYDGTPLL